MQKILKKWGNSLVLVFTKEERDIYKISAGDIVDIGTIRLIGKDNENETEK